MMPIYHDALGNDEYEKTHLNGEIFPVLVARENQESGFHQKNS
jgi:hypothetical protein